MFEQVVVGLVMPLSMLPLVAHRLVLVRPPSLAIYSSSVIFSIDYVNNNPSAFSGAYFEFASLNVYQ